MPSSDNESEGEVAKQPSPFWTSSLSELVDAMEQRGLVRVRLRMGQEEVEVERERTALVEEMRDAGERTVPVAFPATTATSHPQIHSPLIGTFYLRPAPGRPPFVGCGNKVTKNTVVGIVEAMKVMNEVRAGVEGIIHEVLVADGAPVEYGTPLFTLQS